MKTTTIRLWGGAGQSKTKNFWCSQSIENLNNALASGIGESYYIEQAVLKAYANFDGAGGLANVYMKYGFGSTNSISTQLGGEHKITKDSACYPSSGIDVTSYTNRREFKSDYGSHFVANIYTSNIVVGSSGALHFDGIDLIVTYRQYFECTAEASPSNGGTVKSTGTFEGFPGGLYATPNTGYKFVGWYRNGTLISTDLTCYPTLDANNIVFTAVFEKEVINNIRIGKTKPTGIYYNATTKTITFVIAEAATITATGADTVDGYHLAISNTVPSGATEIKGVQIGTTYVYTK